MAKLALLIFVGIFACAGMVTVGAEVSPDAVKRADLIIVATSQTYCGGGYVGYANPIAVASKPRGELGTFYPRLRVDRVLKGKISEGSLFWVSYVVPIELEKGSIFTAGSVNQPVFNLHDIPKEDFYYPNTPHKCVSYIFLFENRKLKSPDSYEAVEKEEILYRNFDYSSGLAPADPETIAQIKMLIKSQGP